MKKSKKFPAAPPASEVPEPSKQYVIEVLRREYAAADDRRRECEREFCYGTGDNPRPLKQLRVLHVFVKGKYAGKTKEVGEKDFDAERDMREVEQAIAEFRAWRDRLFTCQHFQRALDAMPEADRVEGGKKILACLRHVQAIFEVPSATPKSKMKLLPFSIAINPREVADDLRNGVSAEELRSVLDRCYRLAQLPLSEGTQQILRALTRPVQIPDPLNPDNLGTHGGQKKRGDDDAPSAKWKEGKWRAWCVRELAECVPLKPGDGQYNVIAGLLGFAGLGVSSPYVRSVILKGKT